MVVDDEPKILEVKVEALRDAGFEVEGRQYPYHALLQLADNIQHKNPPYALVTDTEMPNLSGAAVITFISPKTNRNDDLILRGSHDVLNVAYHVGDRQKFLEMEGRYNGKTILTSMQELKQKTIDDSLPDKGKRQLAALNEALRISDGVFKIDSDGNGLDNLIEYLRR